MSKGHAQHNENLCDFLIADGTYSDWIITTAFYSALHYVQHELFPLIEGGTTYNTFNEYYRTVQQPIKLSKHKGMIILTKRYLKPCSGQYRWLYDACMNSRYNNYRVSTGKSTTARDKLNAVKSHLKK